MVTGDMLLARDDIIMYQTNCVAKAAKGLAEDIFAQYPHADTYTARQQPSVPGSACILGDGVSQRLVTNLNAQYYPGGPMHTGKDSEEERLLMFRASLWQVATHIAERMQGVVSVGVPWRIGCGLGRGNWE